MQESSEEQARAGLDLLTQAELAHFLELKARFHETFDFPLPFILAVRNKLKHTILGAFAPRLGNLVRGKSSFPLPCGSAHALPGCG